MKQETTAQLRYARMSPRKARLVLDMVRGMRVTDAAAQLQFSTKGPARDLLKLIRSAVANAKHNHAIKEETLVITRVMVDNGPMQYRFTPRAFGRASPIRKRTSHITLVLEGEVGEQKTAKQESEKAKKPEETTVTEEKKPVAKKKIIKKKETK